LRRVERAVPVAVAGHRERQPRGPRRRAPDPRRGGAAGPDPRVRGAVLARLVAGQGLAGADRRVRAREHLHRRRHRRLGVHRARLGRRDHLVPGQDVRVRLHVRLDARHAAPRPHRPADGLRLEVAAARGPAQPVRHGHRDRSGGQVINELIPGLGIVKGMALTLRRFFEPKVTVMYPEVRVDVSPKFRGRLQLLYDEYGTLKCETCFQCAQACPIECIDMGGMDTRGRFHVHWGAPETYGERREESALRRSGRPVPDPAYRPFQAVDLSKVEAILDTYDHDPAHLLAILEETQGAYGYLPVAALK